MAEQPKERALPSLVADDLVDLARRRLIGQPYAGVEPLELSRDVTTDGEDETIPINWTDGRPIALDYAFLELLVEIRDSLGDPALTRLVHVHADATAKTARTTPLVSETDGDILEGRLREALGKLYLGGRLEGAVEGAMEVFDRFLREKGITS